MHPRKTCCLADVRTSYPGITPLYWRAERLEWGAAGRDQLMIWAWKFAVGVVVLGTDYKAAAFREVVCPLRRTSRSEWVKNTLIGRETEHHQSDGSRVVASLAFAFQQQGRQGKLRWFAGPGDTRSPNTLDICCRHLSKP